MVDNRKEKYITKSLEPISLKQTEKILEQMKSNSICRINDKGTGFFVKIPYKSILLTVLITTTQVINTDDIQGKRNISIHLNNDKKIKIIKLDNNRLMYTNEKLDITIIEILLYIHLSHIQFKIIKFFLTYIYKSKVNYNLKNIRITQYLLKNYLRIDLFIYGKRKCR